MVKILRCNSFLSDWFKTIKFIYKIGIKIEMTIEYVIQSNNFDSEYTIGIV